MSPTDFKADLHCHSIHSDGTATVQELFQLAKETGLSGLSITDHDTMDAYKEAVPISKNTGIKLIPGIEFSTMMGDESIHILCYSFPIGHPALTALCERHKSRREERNLAILNKLKARGMPLSEDCLISTGSTGRPHIAQAMVEKGYANSIQDAFNRFIGQEKSCFVPGETISTADTVDIIHEANGLAVIAHPHLIKSNKTINELLKLPFDGIEVFYGNFNRQRIQRYYDIAKEKNLLMTGGSDYHGTIKKQPLGISWIDEETFTPLYNHSLKNNP